MQIKVNNKPQEIAKEITVSELLVINKVDMPDMVSVQRNGEFVERQNFEKTIVKDGDEIDFLYFMGGGL